MSDDRDLGPVLRDWLREVPPPVDRSALAERIVSAAVRTPRAGTRRAGWTHARSTAGRVVALAAVVALGAIAWLALALLGPTPPPAPIPSLTPRPVASPSPSPSPTPAPPGTWVIGSATAAGACASIAPRPPSPIVELRCPAVRWTFDDARLSGTATPSWRIRDVATDAGTIRIRSGGYTLVNEAGAWACRLDDSLVRLDATGALPVNAETVICTGGGRHAGLTAILMVGTTDDPAAIEGILLTRPLPPQPAPDASPVASPGQSPSAAPAPAQS